MNPSKRPERSIDPERPDAGGESPFDLPPVSSFPLSAEELDAIERVRSWGAKPPHPEGEISLERPPA
jgi:hypothetical protein